MNRPPDILTRQPALVRSLPADWVHVSAEIMERVDEPALPELLTRALAVLIPFDYCVQFVYSTDHPPIEVFESPFHDTTELGINNYVNNTYVIDPFYQRYKEGMPSGVYRMRDIAKLRAVRPRSLRQYPVSRMDTEEIGYLTEGWPASREEVCIAIAMPDGRCGEIALSRPWSMRGFCEEELALIRTVLPFLQASFKRYWDISHRPLTNGKAEAALPHRGMENILAPLSSREREVATLLLKGHSTLSVGLQLGISSTTVKTHRKNIYGKLDISTQFELYALLLKSDSANSKLLWRSDN